MAEPPDLNAILTQASTVDERLHACCATSDPLDEGDEAARQKRFEAWRRLWRTHPSAVFARRLACDESKAASLLGKVTRLRVAPPPPWAQALAWIAPAMSRAQVQNRSDAALARDTPFLELLLPVARSAERQLSSRLDGCLEDHASEAARASLRCGLTSSLAHHCAEMLYAEFDLFRRFARMSPNAIQSMSATSRIVYEAFIDDYRENVGERLTEQPVLARILGTVVHFWLEEMTELFSRLRQDSADLREQFGASGHVTRLETNRSEPHRGRRHVAILEFAIGQRIVYKPKDVRIDVAWRSFLGWLADHHSPFALPAANVLARDGYGWSEFIPADERPLNLEFYRRAGAFLAILHMFQAKDFHPENVVAAGGCPVAIDLETLFHPTLSRSTGAGTNDAATATALRALADSVIGTDYLPLWVPLTNGRLFRMSGVDGAAPAGNGTTTFAAVNTDAMSLDAGVTQRFGPASLEASGDDAVPLEDQIGALCDGFETQYLFLHAQRDALMARDGPLARFHGLPVRVIVAGTGEYARVARAAQRGAARGDGTDWSLPFDALGQDILSATGSDAPWLVAAAQRRAMARLDIPYFLANTDATWIQCCDGRCAGGVLDKAPLQRARERLANGGPKDLRRQLSLIRAAVVTGSRTSEEPSAGYEARPAMPSGCSVVGFKEMVLSAARGLVEVISGSAFRAEEGAAWVGIVPVERGKHAVGVLGADLHYGVMGPALFFAAFARTCGDDGARELARAAVASARRIVDPSRQGLRSVHRSGLGGTTGLGSILYGMVQIAALLEEDGLLFDAKRASRLITSERVGADRAFTVSDGAAGAILGLLALHRATGEVAPLDAAIACGRHLLACKASTVSNASAWPSSLDGIMGFLHGATGIHFALSQLSAVTGDDGFLQPAVDEPRSTEHDTALDDVGTLPMCANDSLIDGNCLILDMLATAGIRPEAHTLQTAARARAHNMILRSQERRGFALAGIPNDLHPGLLGGLSGIGYTLLRLMDPGRLPSVVTFQ